MKRITALVIIFSLILAQIVQAAPGAAAPKGLSDIKGHWAEKNIQTLFTKGIITGNSVGKYEPEKPITKAEFTALLVRAMGLQPTTETNSFFDRGYAGYWGKPYIEAAVANGIIIPAEVGTEFYGDMPLKRIDMAMMMARALKLQPSESQESPYIDIPTPNGYLTKLYEEYLMRGYTLEGKVIFKQLNPTTKAEAATVTSRILEYKANPTKFKEAEKQAAEQQKINAGFATNQEFEDFVSSPEAEQYISTDFFKAENNTILFKTNRFSFGDYGDNYKVSDKNFVRINEITYGLMKELAASARKNGHYVKAFYRQSDEWICISYHESKLSGTSSGGHPMFTIVLRVNPTVEVWDTKANKKPTFMFWSIGLLYPNLSELYEKGFTVEQARAAKFQTKEMTDLVNRLFKVSYGSTDGQKIYEHAIKEYELIRLSFSDNDMKNNYTNSKNIYINDIEISNSSTTGMVIFTTNMK